MTDSSMSDGPLSPRTRRWFEFAVHSFPVLLIVTGALRVFRWFGMLETLNGVVSAALLVVMVAGIIHDRRAMLCVTCIDSVPADAGLRAERWRADLRLYHLYAHPTGVVAYLALGVVPLVIHDVWFPSVWLLVVADVVFIGVLGTNWFHHRMQPWCPYCRPWDEGGSHEPSPDPVDRVRGSL